VNVKSKHLKFRLVNITDAEFIYSLRMDDELNKYLSKIDSSIESQIKWLKQYKIREKEEKEYYFVIEDENNNAIGVVRLYDFIEDSFCWGSWILKKKSPLYAAIESALLVYEIGFYNLGFLKSHFDVDKRNAKVVQFHKKIGALIVSEDNKNYYFNFYREKYLEIKQRYTKYL
jgi:RimJ/RimL family protein N-acetyltransferase